MLILKLSLCDSSSVLESLVVEEDDDVGWWCRWRLAFFFFCWWRRVSWRRIWIFSTSRNFPCSTFFLSFCHSDLRFLPPISQRIFLLIPVSFLTDRNRTLFPLSLFSPVCTGVDLSPESLSMIKIFNGVQYGILMGLLKILKRRYLVFDNLSSSHISGQNSNRKGGMGFSMIKGPRS